MLVSGVWRLWLTPRRKSSLAASSSRSWAFCASTWANSWALRMATAISLANSSRRSWSARSQRRVAGRWPTRTPSSLLAGAQDRPDRQRLAGDPLLRRDRGRVDEEDVGVDHAEARRGRPRPRARRGTRRRRAARRSRSPARIRPSSRLRRSRSAARRLWLSARRASSSSPGTTIGVDRSPADDPVDGRGDRPQRRGQVGGQEVGERGSPSSTAATTANSRTPPDRSRSAPTARTDEQDQEAERRPAAGSRRRSRAIVRRVRNDRPSGEPAGSRRRRSTSASAAVAAVERRVGHRASRRPSASARSAIGGASAIAGAPTPTSR